MGDEKKFDEGLEAARKIVKSSGNKFHSKVARLFKEKNWTVIVSPYFVDPSTYKSREVDIIAEKIFNFNYGWRGSKPACVRIRLHIECKYIGQHMVFWFDNLNDDKPKQLLDSKTPFKEGAVHVRSHHYLKGGGKVAKLFANESSREIENDQFFKAINQCLNGFVVNRGNSFELDSGYRRCVATIEYPVIVCSAFEKLFKVGMAEDEPVRIDENFLFEVNYSYPLSGGSALREYFLVDVVKFDGLGKFLSNIDGEVAEIENMDWDEDGFEGDCTEYGD